MARLHKEFTGVKGYSFDKKLRLTDSRKKDLKGSRKSLRKKIREWFKENKPNELSPKFKTQGSYIHDTAVNPIVEKDDDGNSFRKYDLDDGIYFIESEGKHNKRTVQTWHDWVYKAVKGHTGNTKKKTTCVRVIFSDGHHIDLPIYYSTSNDATPELAHKSKDWLDSDPKEFSEWVNKNCNSQVKRIIRYLKGWRNYREIENSNLKLPSGFVLTILVQKYFHQDENDDVAFRETVRRIHTELNKRNGFKCYRPTTPSDEDLFKDFSETRKNDFLNNLKKLTEACDNANKENNFKKASEYLREQLGDRFPLGENKEQEKKSNEIKKSLAGTEIKPKPYGGKR